MTQQRRRRSSRVSRPRRAVEWFDTHFAQLLLTGTLITLNLSSQILDDEKKGMTVKRLIVDLRAQLSVAGTGGSVSMGVAMVSTEAAVAGAFPEPSDPNMEASWMWKQVNSTVSATNLSDFSSFTPFQIDTKTMRKFRFREQELRFIMEVGVTTAPININGLVRVLAAKS